MSKFSYISSAAANNQTLHVIGAKLSDRACDWISHDTQRLSRVLFGLLERRLQYLHDTHRHSFLRSAGAFQSE
jgi:hypothetical protein